MECEKCKDMIGSIGRNWCIVSPYELHKYCNFQPPHLRVNSILKYIVSLTDYNHLFKRPDSKTNMQCLFKFWVK